MSKRVLCKFFAQGACLKGDRCEFSHDWKAPPNNICTYYQKGTCTYGSRCRYEHVKVSQSQASPSSSSLNLPFPTESFPGTAAHGSAENSSSSTLFCPPRRPAWGENTTHHDLRKTDDGAGYLRSSAPADQPICPFGAAGDCSRGEKCPYVHGDICATCGKHCLHPFRPEEREEHIKICEKNRKRLEALKRSQEIECSVCLERVFSKPPAERKFGILSECDHSFCISCIRNWRSSSLTSGLDVNSALRACPICRKLSYFVIPSVIWYCSKEEKQDIVDSYKTRLRSIDCKHFEFGNGTCPFGTSCFYKHTVKPGSFLWNATLYPELYSSDFRDIVEVESSSDTSEINDSQALAEHFYSSHIAMENEELENFSDEDLNNIMTEVLAMFPQLLDDDDDDDDYSSDE